MKQIYIYTKQVSGAGEVPVYFISNRHTQEEAPSGELLEGAVRIPCFYCLNSYWVKRSERQALGAKPVTWGKIGNVFRTSGSLTGLSPVICRFLKKKLR